jgi:hypothetical protein
MPMDWINTLEQNNTHPSYTVLDVAFLRRSWNILTVARLAIAKKCCQMSVRMAFAS